MSRDDQFKGLAGLLVEEIRQELNKLSPTKDSTEIWDQKECEVIAARLSCYAAYVIGYTIEHLNECGHNISTNKHDQILSSIPDIGMFAGYRLVSAKNMDYWIKKALAAEEQVNEPL